MPRKSTKKRFIWAVGRRKTSIATIKLFPKKGEILVNAKPIKDYFPGQVNELIYNEPLRSTNLQGKISANIKIKGGGKESQLEAVIHAFSRAINELDKEKYHEILKKKDFLTRDPRMKERRKPGNAQKARAKKQSPKR